MVATLKEMLLDNCRWEWLFGIENRDKIFPIRSSYKFNPIVVEKGSTTGDSHRIHASECG